MASGHTGNVVPGNRLWVRVPCPPPATSPRDLKSYADFFVAPNRTSQPNFGRLCSQFVAKSGCSAQRTWLDGRGRWRTSGFAARADVGGRLGTPSL
jgi:hypothetical protein